MSLQKVLMCQIPIGTKVRIGNPHNIGIDKIADVLSRYIRGWKKYFIVSSVVILLFLCVSLLFVQSNLLFILWPLFAFVILSAIKQKTSSFSAIILLLLVVSFFTTYLLLQKSEYKEHETRKIFAQKLSAEQDPLAEHLFTQDEFAMSMDTSLVHILFPADTKLLPKTADASHELFKQKLIAKYFSGYWEKYEVNTTVFDTACFAVIPNPVSEKNNPAYFENIIASEGILTESNSLFYLKNSVGRISYLARIPLIVTRDFSHRVGDLFIEFNSRIISEETGFPELMLDKRMSTETKMGKDYSYGKYKDGKLISYHGKFPYSSSAEVFLPENMERKSEPLAFFTELDDYSHLSYLSGMNTLTVVSKKKDGTLGGITTFSYLFAFFSLFFLLLRLLRLMFFHRDISLSSFSSRIQVAMVAIVLFSLLFFGAGTVYYIQKQYDRQTRQSVRDKMVSAQVEATQELGDETELKPSKSDFFSYILKRMSNIFISDLNLYDSEGNLIASSQKKLFDEGLLSRKMNPKAYLYLVLRQDMEFIQEEEVGHLSYISAYCSLRNNNGDLLGYLNIPYFARQSELEKEIAAILAAIINVYVLLFVLSIILALTLSEYFARPLKLIREKLHQVQLGKASEPIEWKSRDEIGSLVSEYNRMIEELQKSAELLAKSERETAWREMAKQVAHEIKNPLTPMKLSIQHLQRIFKNKDADIDKKIEHITETLVEQIEALSTIAGEFASFAKMPVTINEKINIKNILENTVALFRDSTDAEIILHTPNEDVCVFADKEQMVRVCNNLLKNALQAIPDYRQGTIELSLEKKNNILFIKVKDNGLGINQEQLNKIFTPNFTTKSGGMGLGLAMVKSIVETFNGKIWFETSTGKGTTFFVSLPEYKDTY